MTFPLVVQQNTKVFAHLVSRVRIYDVAWRLALLANDVFSVYQVTGFSFRFWLCALGCR